MFAGQLRMFERLFIVDTSNISDQTAGLLVYIKHKINAMFVAMIVASLATTGVNVYFWCQDRDQIMLTSKLLTDYFSPGSIIVKLFNFIETFADIIACIPTVTIPAYFIYLFYHVEVQLLLLTDYVRSLHNEHERTFTNKMGLSTENYHSISNSVKKIVKWHLEIKQYNYEIFAINQMVHFLYICTGLLVSIFSLFSLFSVNIPYENTVNSMHLSEAIYDLDWYNWDVKCQKLYLMLITHTTKGIQVTIFMLFGINKELLKKVSRY
uniref:Odorant receptor n=1 Tax=Dendroctonus ponderosae TaxID=77166 RepID=A0AAR5QAN9_DENPD